MFTNYVIPTVQMPYSVMEAPKQIQPKIVFETLEEVLAERYGNLSAQEIILLSDIGEEKFYQLSKEQRDLIISVFDSVDIGQVEDPEYLLESARESVYNE